MPDQQDRGPPAKASQEVDSIYGLPVFFPRFWPRRVAARPNWRADPILILGRVLDGRAFRKETDQKVGGTAAAQTGQFYEAAVPEPLCA